MRGRHSQKRQKFTLRPVRNYSSPDQQNLIVMECNNDTQVAVVGMLTKD